MLTPAQIRRKRQKRKTDIKVFSILACIVVVVAFLISFRHLLPSFFDIVKFLIVILPSVFLIAFAEAMKKTDKEMWKVEENLKGLGDIVISVQQVKETQPSQSPYKGSEWSASEPSFSTTGTATPSPDADGSCNAATS